MGQCIEKVEPEGLVVKEVFLFLSQRESGWSSDDAAA